ncbi:hypothetical protein BC477_19445 [Clavibacter michiganensis subsp. michiganensis]|uniref:Uncharacterized protein n=1 Tax=Clavibacter michiganensis subsp. michiganensis TaxID=33013 RepID=A0A251XGI7_CLAMM|nr:hypothetical protein BC477_19445 [Clavibacter michiganensis subsp. michiganensis]OUE01659.1 hypothetical protein CMMCAS07_15230 [Clavibacter michiganensis subsp. michiganensis]
MREQQRDAASAASRVPYPTTTVRKPSWLTVPYARTSLRSICLRARQPPTSIVATPSETSRTRQPGTSA